MEDKINTIRSALERAQIGLRWYRDAHPEDDSGADDEMDAEIGEALASLDQLEAMAGEHEPVAWAVYWGLPPTRQNSVHFDKESAQAVANQIKSATEVRPLYAAPVAQQYEAGDVASAAAQGFRDGVASVQQGEPVAWAMPKGDGTFIDVITPAEHARDEGSYTVPLFAAPVAQQPQARPDFTDEWTGYLKDGETPFERFLRERKDVQSVLKLYQRALEENERLKAQQPQAEAVQACGHSMSLLLRSAESNEPLYCEACDDKSGRHDAERRETELLDANRRLQEKIGSADALKLHAIEELCQLGYTVKDGELFPPDHLHKLMEAANHPLCGKQTEAVPSSDLNPDEGDPVTLWAEIWRLREAIKGPDGYATWQDAATAERIRRVRAESKHAAPVAQQPTFDARRALEAIEALLSNIRRDAPNLSGKVMGFAEEVAAALRHKVAQQPAPGSTAEYEQWVKDGRPVAQQPQAEPQDVGQLEYRGNSVAYIHQKMTAYRSAIDAAWEAMRDAGHPPDGHTPLAQAITKALAPPQAEVVPPGFVLVPVEPTPEMLEVGKEAHYEAEVRIQEPGAYEPRGFGSRKVRVAHVYRAMLAAAQGAKA